MNIYKRRRIAWHIKHCRSYITWNGDTPSFQWPVTRGSIPLRLWFDPYWRSEHITQPAIRIRLKWLPERIKQMPLYVLPDKIIEDRKLR